MSEMEKMSKVETLQCEVSLMKSVQDKMAELLTRAPYLSIEEEKVVLQRYIDLIRTRSDEMIIFIQVMLKVKKELAFARLDLERAITSNNNVNEARKRVEWLTERLKNLSKMCHNYFYDLQKEISNASFHADGGDSAEFPTDVMGSCICGMLNSVEEETLNDVQSDVRKVLEASSDVLVCRPGSVKKVFKPSKTPSYDEIDTVNLRVEFVNKGDEVDDDLQTDDAEDSHNAFNPLSYLSLTKAEPKKSEHSLSAIRVRKSGKSKVDSLVTYQKHALDKLLERFQHIYADMEETPVPSTQTLTTDSSKESQESKKLQQSKELQESASAGTNVTRTVTSSSLPDIRETRGSAFRPSQRETRYNVATVSSEPSDDDMVCTALISIGGDESSLQLPKKAVFPRSPSQWCEFASCSSATLINHHTLSRKKDGQTSKDSSIGQKTGGCMKRAVNRVKAFTKLKMIIDNTDTNLAKKKRIESLIGKHGIQSDNKNIAVDAAKALGQLKCRNESVTKSLKFVIKEDKRKLLVYECAKSMILLGCWPDCAMDVLTYHLKYGNQKVQEDILLTIKLSRNAHFIPKSSGTLISLSNVLMDLLHHADPEISFNAAFALGLLCIRTEQARWLLLDSLINSSDIKKYEALNILVKQMNCRDDAVVDALLLQLSNANSLKHRMKAVDLLRDIGLKRLEQYGIKRVFNVLQELLWNHSNKGLQEKIVTVLKLFGLRNEAAANVLRRLSDKSETVRADSIVALATLEMKGERELKILLDMFDLDSSPHVRTQVIKAFVDMKWNHPLVMRALEDRQKADDILAEKAMSAINYLSTLSLSA